MCSSPAIFAWVNSRAFRSWCSDISSTRRRCSAALTAFAPSDILARSSLKFLATFSSFLLDRPQMAFEQPIRHRHVRLIPTVVAPGLSAQFPHLGKEGCLDLRTEGKPEIGAALHQQTDVSIDFSLLGFGQRVPPLFELICEFDLPSHALNIAWVPYGSHAIFTSGHRTGAPDSGTLEDTDDYRRTARTPDRSARSTYAKRRAPFGCYQREHGKHSKTR